MTYEETREGNRLIMRFMGAVIQTRTNPVKYNVQFFHPYRKSKLCWTGYSSSRKSAIKASISLGGHFHTDWNYIIPAYKKLSEQLWIEKKEKEQEELIKFMNKAIADDNPQFAFESIIDAIKESAKKTKCAWPDCENDVMVGTRYCESCHVKMKEKL